VGKTEKNKPQGRPSCRWKNNIKTNLQRIESSCACYEQISGSCERDDEASGSLKLGEFLEILKGLYTTELIS
jgi:hypothetical protein